MTREESTIHREAILAFLDGKQIEMRPPDGDRWTPTSEPEFLPDWHYQVAPMKIAINVERMIDECIPNGNLCDPQDIADAIRTYCEQVDGE